MAEKLYLIKMGEISLKGGNRDLFEKRLRHNIKDKLRPWHSEVSKQKGRLYAYIDEECPDELIEKALSTTCGLTGYARAYSAEKTPGAMDALAREILPGSFTDEGTFRITVTREDKKFPMDSHEIAVELAKTVHELFPSLTVDLKNPRHVLNVEVRKKVYMYTTEKKGESGLPVGTAGRGMLLLSGGIDSPVAGVMMAKRGMKLDAIYFHAYPYTSELALEKVKTLSSLIAPYTQGLRLFVVPFTEGQLHIKKHAETDETTLMFRASMMQTAEKLCKANGALAIVTGEAMSQVASQTLEAMSFTDSMTELLVIRPLAGMDKEEIVNKAKKLGTYTTSILPYEDCCVIFSPKHPVTHPDKEVSRSHFEALEMGPVIDKAIAETVVYDFNAMGEEVKG